MEIIILLLFLIPFFLSCYAILKIRINGSDNAYHLIMIEAIAENKNRFISKMPYFVATPRHSYPQLLHWVFSFLDSEKQLKYARFTGVFFNLLIGVSLYFLSAYYYNNFLLGTSISYTKFALITASIFAFSPIQYDLVNAKNVGFSARGLGLFLGTLFLFSILFFLHQGHYKFIVFAGIIAFIILISNVFATQFLILFSIIISIVFKNTILLTPPIIGIILFFISMPKVARSFFKGQLVHKVRYFKVIAPMGILKNRYSIWRDFVYDFWKQAHLVVKKEITVITWLKYVSTNPLVNLLVGVPFIILFCVNYSHSTTLILDKLIASTLILFLLTSFRPTRFIGEPERYAEFSLGLLSMSIAINYYNQTTLLYAVLVFCVVFILGRILVSKRLISNNVNAITRNKALLFKDKLEEISKTNDVKILCNSSQITKMLLSSKYQTFRHPIFNNKIGTFMFKDLYEEAYDFLKPSIIKPVIEEFNINYYVYLGDSKDLKNQKQFQLLQEDQHLSLYKIIK